MMINNGKGVDFVPQIKPVSDLRNYNNVLRDVAVNQPVFLTKNGRGRYALLDMEDYERMQTAIRLLSVIERGEQAAKEGGGLSIEEVETSLGIV